VNLGKKRLNNKGVPGKSDISIKAYVLRKSIWPSVAVFDINVVRVVG
jgi:hypothetical protein